MGFFENFFGNNKNVPKVICPRCLGKGHVDEADIKRLKKELFWLPGDCAYCNTSGEVDADLETKIAVDESYLTNNLDDTERRKLMKNNSEAKKRAEQFNRNMEDFIQLIKMLYYERKLTVPLIAEFFLIKNTAIKPGSEDYIKQKNELIDYIKRVIESDFPKN